VSALCAFEVTASAAPDEIKFIGTALRQEFNVGTLSWIVSVDQLLSGPTFCPSPITVIVGGGVLPAGYVDPNVTVGNKVEVYGEVETMFWDSAEGGGVICTVFLSQSYHYFRGSADPCQLDSDRDGVPDCRDRCANTPPGTRVDEFGCPVPDPCQVDSDRDGVPDCRDRCANTPPGTRVDEYGCPLPPPLPSQYNVLVQVSDATTGGRISGATVALDGNWAATTNPNGEATLTVSPGSHEIAAWKEGYDWATVRSYIDRDMTIRISLRRHDSDGDGVPDNEDRCPDKPGPRENNGCPLPENKPPIADFSITPANPRAGEPIYFTDKSYDPDGSVVSWRWDFGDGATTTIQHPSHIYSITQNPTICLTVTDNKGATGKTCKSVRLQPGPTGSAPFIRSWLICGSFTYQTNDEKAAHNKDYIGEKSIEPSAGTSCADKTWKAHHDSDDYIDLDGLLIPNNYSIAYAHIYVESPRTQAVQLRIGSDDAVKVWLNGSLVHEKFVFRPAVKDEDITTVTLNAGWNRLLIKVLDGLAGWGFYARLTDNNGDEVEGLKYQLDKPTIPREKPDLIITGITWSPANPKQGDRVTFNVEVKNQGSGDAGRFMVSLFINLPEKLKTYFDEKEISGLAAGATTTAVLTKDTGFLTQEMQCDVDYTIQAVADIYPPDRGQVDESNESNNEFSKTI
jgi:PKD repeat protein